MDIEGSVQVTVDWDGNRIRAVRVRSTRSDRAQALLAGRQADEAEVLLPRVFSICARAQAAAVSAALDAAREGEERDALHGEMAVLAEVALEYLWRLQIDLPNLLGLPQRTEALMQLRRELGRAGGTKCDWRSFIDMLRAAVHTESGINGEPFDSADPAAFSDWEARSDAPAARLLRALRAVPLQVGGTVFLPRMTKVLLREIGSALGGDPAFSRRPTYAGAAAESGARVRLAEHPLLRAMATSTSGAYQRILARWLELSGIPERLTRLLEGEAPQRWVQGVTLGPGCGIAGVETARGLLVHAATLAGDRVTAYRIVAPTEWNFHPRGALLGDLLDVAAREATEVEQRAALAVQSLDPCVRYTLELARHRDA
jgi:hypothetical protein